MNFESYNSSEIIKAEALGALGLSPGASAEEVLNRYIDIFNQNKDKIVNDTYPEEILAAKNAVDSLLPFYADNPIQARIQREFERNRLEAERSVATLRTEHEAHKARLDAEHRAHRERMEAGRKRKV